jgi:hypothetical protein
MALFSIVITEGNARQDEMAGEYPDASDAIDEAKRFLFDVGRDILTRDDTGSVRIQVRTAAGGLVFDANLDYAVHAEAAAG